MDIKHGAGEEDAVERSAYRCKAYTFRFSRLAALFRLERQPLGAGSWSISTGTHSHYFQYFNIIASHQIQYSRRAWRSKL